MSTKPMRTWEVELDELPKKVDLADAYEIITKKGGRFLSTENDDSSPNYVGIEYESAFSPGTVQLRKIYAWIAERPKLLKRLESLTGSRKPTSGTIKNLVKTYILPQATDILMQTPHQDGGGLEAVAKPATLAAHQRLKPEYAKIIDVFKNFGFSDTEGGDGIHSNIDKTLFGADKVTRLRAFENFLWFLFFNIDFMVEFTDRKRIYQYNADLHHQMGDVFALGSDEEILSKFKSQKLQLLKVIENSEAAGLYGRVFNMTVNRDGRPCVEFRWFGSTHNIEKFMSNIEFSFALPEFCQTIKTENLAKLSNFCTFVRSNHDKYPHLLADLMTNSYAIEEFAHQEQQTSRLVIS